MPYSSIQGVKTPLPVLKDAASIHEDSAFAFKRWVETARKVASLAGDYEVAGDAELAYINYMKLAGILSALLKHREYNEVKKLRAQEYLGFQALQEQWQPTLAKIRRLEEQLKSRDSAENGVEDEHASPTSVYSLPSAPNSPIVNTTSRSRGNSNSHADDSASIPGKRASIAERIAALQNSGGSTATFVKHSPKPSLPTVSDVLEQDSHTSSAEDAPSVGLGLNTLRGVRRPASGVPPAKPPKPASFASTSIVKRKGSVDNLSPQATSHANVPPDSAQPLSIPERNEPYQPDLLATRPPHVVDQDIARPGSAPITMSDDFQHSVSPPSLPDDSVSSLQGKSSSEAPTILQSQPVKQDEAKIEQDQAETSRLELRPSLDHSISDFHSSFPTVEDLDEQYAFPKVPKGRLPSLPDVPKFEPSKNVNRLGRPPDLFPRPAASDEQTNEVLSDQPSPMNGHGSYAPTTPSVTPSHSGSQQQSPKHAPILSLSEKQKSPLKRSSAIKGGLSARTSPSSQPMSLPLASSILPHTLWTYIQAAIPPSILLIDVRPRPSYDKMRIGARNAASICLEPIILRKELTSAELKSNMFDNPQHEQEIFAKRSEYDLVVLYDHQTSALPSNLNSATSGPSRNSADEDSRCLWILNQAIYMNEFGRPLKRAPVLLVGGLKAWIKEIGPAGLIGTHVELPKHRDSISEARAKLEGTSLSSNRQSLIDRGINPPPLVDHSKRPPSLSSSEEKRQNRRAVMYDDGQTPIARNVADIIAHPSRNLAYQPSLTSPNDQNYFAPQSRQPSLPFQSPSLAYPKQALRSTSGSHDQYKPSLSQVEYASQPYTGYAPHVQTNHRPVDYPQIGPPAVNALQRPPQAAQPNGVASARLGPPNLSPQHRRISSQFTQTLSSSPTGLSLKGKGDVLVPLDWYDGTVGVTGLKNLGNTCYMNSTIQCLSATIPFSKFFTEGSFRKQINTTNPLGTKGALADTVAQLFRVLWEEQYSFVSPISFRDAICRFAPQFGGSDQHDSQEFLAFLLDGLHEDLNLVVKKPPPVEMTPEREAEFEALPTAIASHQQWELYLRRDNSLIVHWFQGQYQSRLQCQTCGKTSTTFNTFMYLSLPVPRTRNNKSVSLEECVAAFCKEEILDKEDAWRCPQCKQPRRATKRLTIARLPPILLIHFKRFSFHGPFSDKIDTPIDFPVYGLNLSSYLPPSTAAASDLYSDLDVKAARQGSASYDLYGISQHFGTLSSGHYTAMIRSRRHWRHIGDTRMSDCEEGDVKKAGQSAYILFYRQRL